MFASSFEYLTALRVNDFMLFLRWPEFLDKKYSTPQEPLNAECLMDCLVFEWMSCGFNELDVDKMALLSAIQNLDSSPIEQGIFSFNMTTLNIALLNCMVLSFHGVNGQNFPKDPLNTKQIGHLMEEETHRIGMESLKASINEMHKMFTERAASVNKNLVSKYSRKMNALIQMMSLVSEYIDLLASQQAEEEQESLYGMRLALARSVLCYLNQQPELTEDVCAQIAIYVNTIKRHRPMQWEDQFLKKLLPRTVMEKSWSFFTFLGTKFFSLVATSEQKNTEPNQKINI